MALIGAGGYAALAHKFYNVPPARVADWALHGMQRPEAGAKKIWGVARNLTWKNIRIVAANHAFYTIAIPHVEETAGTKAMRRYTRPRALPGFLAAAGLASLGVAALMRARARPIGAPKQG